MADPAIGTSEVIAVVDDATAFFTDLAVGAGLAFAEVEADTALARQTERTLDEAARIVDTTAPFADATRRASDALAGIREASAKGADLSCLARDGAAWISDTSPFDASLFGGASHLVTEFDATSGLAVLVVRTGQPRTRAQDTDPLLADLALRTAKGVTVGCSALALPAD